MSRVIHKVQFQVKKTSNDLFTYSLKVMTGSWIGLFFAHIFQAFWGFSDFLFLFVILLFTGVTLRITKNYGWGGILLFNVFFVLLFLVFKYYVLQHPGNL